MRGPPDTVKSPLESWTDQLGSLLWVVIVGVIIVGRIVSIGAAKSKINSDPL